MLFADRHNRNTDGERASFSFAFAGSRDIASVKFDDGFRNREAHSQAALRACRSSFSLAEALEYERKKVRFDASAIVRNAYLDMRVHSIEYHLHAAALRREFDGIRQEVPHHLLQPLEIARHRTGMRVEYGLNPDVAGFGRKAQ